MALQQQQQHPMLIELCYVLMDLYIDYYYVFLSFLLLSNQIIMFFAKMIRLKLSIAISIRV